MEFFSLFYQLNVYGQDLFYHLKGWDNGMQDFVAANNQFPTIWLVTFFSALLVSRWRFLLSVYLSGQEAL